MENTQEYERLLPNLSKAQVLATGATLLGSVVLDTAMHWEFGPLLGTAFAVIIAARHGGHIVDASGEIMRHLVWGQDATTVHEVTDRVLDKVMPQSEEVLNQSAGAKLNRLFGRDKREVNMEVQQDEPYVDERPEDEMDEQDFTSSRASINNTPSIQRFTVEQFVSHTERNSYKAFIGRSLTQERNPAVAISFYKRHLKIIGASQKGKSSMAAALLDTIARTHDPERVMIALLDLEDMTSKLFTDLPHLAEVTLENDETVLLHGRTPEQVLEYLGYIVDLMNYRYKYLSKVEVEQEPLLIVYLEEFLALKDHFKLKIDQALGKDKEQAKSDYAQLVYCIKEIARRGLKVKVQFLMCAQVDYRDEDLQEALINVTSGMCFCVRSTAANAAGFMQTEFLNRNAKENKKGQAVVEMPDCTDLILAPEYDLEKLLIAWEKIQPVQEFQGIQNKKASPIAPAGLQKKVLTPVYTQPTPVYQNVGSVNKNVPIYTPLNGSFNGSTSQTEAQSELRLNELRLNEQDASGTLENAQGSTLTVNVNGTQREMIKRLNETKKDTKLTHADIAKIVKLYGPNYKIYQAVCREENISLEREA